MICLYIPRASQLTSTLRVEVTKREISFKRLHINIGRMQATQHFQIAYTISQI